MTSVTVQTANGTDTVSVGIAGPQGPPGLSGVPLVQNVAYQPEHYTPMFEVTQSGSTSPLSPFAQGYVGHDYGAFFPAQTTQIRGYNPFGVYSTTDAQCFESIHPWAGDSNSLEWVMGAIPPTSAINANGVNFMMYFLNRATGSGQFVLRHGPTADSYMVLASPTVTYLNMSPTSGFGSVPGTSFGASIQVSPPAGSGAANILLSSQDSNSFFFLNVPTTTQVSGFQFMINGSAKWIMQVHSGFFSLVDESFGNTPWFIQPVAGDVSLFRTQSTFRVETGSLIVGSAAVATTATRGFLYIPSCAGPPTGVPVTQPGTIPLVYDSTDNQIYVYNGGVWKAITLS